MLIDMAIEFARLEIYSRSTGRNSVDCAAYRAGEQLYDARTGQTFDYSHREDILYQEILLPEGASEKFLDRAILWNAVEFSETRKDAQLAKDLELALPKELSLAQHQEMTRQFAIEHFVQHGLAVDIAIHGSDTNPHAHLLITLRRIEGNQLSAKKARDLNPIFYGVKQKTLFDPWKEKWREFQNTYFLEKGIDLTVDEGYLLSTKHEGRVGHSVKADNLIRKEASYLQAQTSPAAILEYLSDRYATFSEKELASVVLKNTHTPEDYDRVFKAVQSDANFIFLGHGEDGRTRYTTRFTYEREDQMLRYAQSLAGRRYSSRIHSTKTTFSSHSFSNKKIDAIGERFSLNAEQLAATRYLVQAGDIACLVGRAGTGKTYTMKAVHALYQERGYKIYGAAISGVAAHTLEKETGIRSDTIYSLIKRIEKNRFQPEPGSILIIDEAGMIPLREMSILIEFTKRNHSKLLLLGDPDQLQPIMAGAPFRALLDQIGFVEMQHIQRQLLPGDRIASTHLAQGAVGLAIDHYVQEKKLHVEFESQEALIKHWKNALKIEDAQIDKATQSEVEGTRTGVRATELKKQIILAHTKKEVFSFNEKVRAALLDAKIFSSEKSVTLRNASREIALTAGDRILFLRNNYALSVFNGNFGTIEKIHGTELTVQLDSGRRVTFDTKKYRDFDYGYATTLHKSQGSTFDRVLVSIDSFGWNKSLAYVAMTRHRHSLDVFVNSDRFNSLEKLKRQLSRNALRDNAIDFPLSFAEKRGFDAESLLGRTLNHIAGLGNEIRDGWLYLTQYEDWVKHRTQQLHQKELLSVRAEAKKIAAFADLNRTVQGRYREVRISASNQDTAQRRDYDALVTLAKKRDTAAYDLLNTIQNPSEKILDAHGFTLAQLKRYADRSVLSQENQIKNKSENKIELLQQTFPENPLEIFQHPEWKNILSYGTNDYLLKNQLDLLKKIHHTATTNKLVQQEPDRQKYLMQAFTSTIQKINENTTFSDVFTKQVPRLSKIIFERIPLLQKSFGMQKSQEKGMERGR